MADAAAPPVDPMEGATKLPDSLDIAGVMNSLKTGFSAAASQVSDSVGDFMNIMSRATATKAAAGAATMGAASAEATVSDLEEEQAIAHKQANSGAIAALSTNRDASSALLATLSAGIVNGQQDIDARAKMIDQKIDVGITDDPLQWLANKFTLPVDIAGYNARVSQQNQRQAAMTSAEALLSKDAADISTIDSSDSISMLAAKHQVILNKAAAAVAESKYQLAGLGIEALNARNAATTDVFNMQDRLYGAVVQGVSLQQKEVELNIQSADEKQRVRTNDIADQYRQTQEGDIKLRDQYRSDFQAAIDKTTAVLGMQKISIDMIPNLRPDMKQALFNAMSSVITDQNGFTTLGAAPVLAMNNVADLNAPLTPGTRKTYDFMRSVADPTIQQLAKAGTKINTQEAQVAINSAIVSEANRQKANIQPTGGVFSPPPLSAVLNSPSLTNVWKLGLRPELQALATANPAHETDANEILTVAALKIAGGKETLEQAAADISTIYTHIKMDNEFQHRYTLFGIVPPDGFNTQVNTGGMSFRATAIYDMTNQVQMQNALLQIMRSQQLTGAGLTSGAGLQ